MLENWSPVPVFSPLLSGHLYQTAVEVGEEWRSLLQGLVTVTIAVIATRERRLHQAGWREKGSSKGGRGQKGWGGGGSRREGRG